MSTVDREVITQWISAQIDIWIGTDIPVEHALKLMLNDVQYLPEHL